MMAGRTQSRTDREYPAHWIRKDCDAGVEMSHSTANRKLFNEEAQIDRWTNEGGALVEREGCHRYRLLEE
jgi:hypothetical protein